MSYELAKKLKEAGFPQTGTHFDNNGDMYGWSNDVYYPTLEELIEACGDEFDFLHMTPNRNSWACHSQTDEAFGAGSTPTEAVARLWLALNNKIK